jgi:CheY-like chemotaxis protein
MKPKGKILIVDDEPLNVKLMKANLLYERYQTSESNRASGTC